LLTPPAVQRATSLVRLIGQLVLGWLAFSQLHWLNFGMTLLLLGIGLAALQAGSRPGRLS
jgi:hypothetical protein